jgi:hypothetical protein
MFVVGYTESGTPYGCYEDEFEDVPSDVNADLATLPARTGSPKS